VEEGSELSRDKKMGEGKGVEGLEGDR